MPDPVKTAPVEVTPEMLQAGIDRYEDLYECYGPDYVVTEVYQAMREVELSGKMRLDVP